MIKKIIIAGVGGQGVKFISRKLASILIAKGYEVSLAFSYDAAIKGGDIFSNIIYSDAEVENPVIEKADLLISLSEIKEEFDALEIIKIPEVLTKGYENSEIPKNLRALKLILEKLGFAPDLTD